MMNSTKTGVGISARLHYLDWLQVFAVLGVFLFHALFPFNDFVDWHIKNVERSTFATLYSFLFTPWGMPFFFLMAGVTSWFSLRQRTPGRYVRERVSQLLIPFIIGVFLLTPIEAYYVLAHRGWWQDGSIIEFVLSAETRTYFFTEFQPISFGPEAFGAVGYHLWFVAFLFVFAVIALPVFLWLKEDVGQRFIAWVARLAKRRGGLLVFVLPLMVIRFILQPFFPDYTGWSDFTFMLLFYISGHILISDQRLMRAIRRDWLLYLILGLAGALYFFSEAVGIPVLDWMASPGAPGFYFTWTVFCLNAWCWSMIMLTIGMRFLNISNKWLRYSREASFAFFWVHYPVTFFTAFYAVQWEIDLPIKMWAVLVGSFIISLFLYELLIRRVNPMRAVFGMKPQAAAKDANERP